MMMKTIRNLVLLSLAMICGTAIYIAYGYYDLKHRELDVQVEITRALVRQSRPSMQWPEKL
jgi:hypothetical protein